MKKLIFALVVVVLLATAQNANAKTRGHHSITTATHYSYANSDVRYGKVGKTKKLLGINRHSYKIVKR